MFETICIGFAFAVGLAARAIGLPPLIGYLGAGFLISIYSVDIGIPDSSFSSLEHIAHYGVLLLLFTVGLKLNIKKVARVEVIGTSVFHFALSTAIYAPIIYFLMDTSVQISVMLGIALSFSSTVLAAKTLEGKQELKAFHGRVAIGILIAQDLIAMAVMSIANGQAPSVWALCLFALPLLRPLLYKLFDASGNEELMLLFGLLVAIVFGGGVFELLGLSGELGALIMGALLAGHKKAPVLSEKLWGLKEIFLVGFFLTIGMKGMPTVEDWKFAVAMTLLLPIQVVVFFGLLISFKLKARSAFLTTATLTNFSEFGLIVSAAIMPEWTVAIALAVALSFIVSAPLNRFAHQIFDRIENKVSKFERNVRHPDEEIVNVGSANILVMGMGRVGTAVYDRLDNVANIIGIDSDQDLVKEHQDNGLNVQYADAEHFGFWDGIDLSGIEYCILAMKHPDASTGIVETLRKSGFTGIIVAHALHEEAAEQIRLAGANETYITAIEAGDGLASRVCSHMQLN